MTDRYKSPDCRDGNHQKCDGIAWDMVRDESTWCGCQECGHALGEYDKATQ